jgi:hypothetical protein
MQFLAYFNTLIFLGSNRLHMEYRLFQGDCSTVSSVSVGGACVCWHQLSQIFASTCCWPDQKRSLLLCCLFWFVVLLVVGKAVVAWSYTLAGQS